MVKYLTPGPVQLPERVIRAYSRQPMFHRGSEFGKLLRDVLDKLGRVFEGYEYHIMPGTGTFAVDVAVYNFVNPGDNVIVLVNGEFSDRMANSFESRGAKVTRIYFNPGEDVCVRLSDVEEAFSRIKPRALALVHNETSMGVANRCIDELSELAHREGSIVIVDAVSSIPAEPVPTKADVIATATHKAFLAPPGGAIIAYKDPKMLVNAPLPPSMDIKSYIKYKDRYETPYTPPINILYALSESLSYILDELGLEKYRLMHVERANYLYGELPRLGFKPVAVRDEYRSITVTAFYTHIEPAKVVEHLRLKGYVVSGGMWKIRDRSFRIGVMGDIDLADLRNVVESLRELTAANH